MCLTRTRTIPIFAPLPSRSTPMASRGLEVLPPPPVGVEHEQKPRSNSEYTHGVTRR